MTWLQTLAIAMGPAAITALSLYFQQRLTNRREEAQRTHDSHERRMDRTAVERNEATREVMATKHDVEAALVELLNAMDEIYYKLDQYHRWATSPSGDWPLPDGFPTEPHIGRLLAADSAARLKVPWPPNIRVDGPMVTAGDAVTLLLDLHSTAEATGSSSSPGEYHQLRVTFVSRARVLLDEIDPLVR